MFFESSTLIQGKFPVNIVIYKVILHGVQRLQILAVKEQSFFHLQLFFLLQVSHEVLSDDDVFFDVLFHYMMV